MYNPIKKQITLYACVLATSFAAIANGQECLIQDNGCLYSVEGNCLPRRTTYGFYQTHWRTWPFAVTPKVPTLKKKVFREPQGSTTLPEAEIPRSKDEASLNPELPSKPEELAQDVNPAPADTQYQLDRQTDPFVDENGAAINSAPSNNGDGLIQEPAPTSPPAESPFGDDLNDLDDFSSGGIRLDRQRGLSRSPANPLRRHIVPVQAPTTRYAPTTRRVTHLEPVNGPRHALARPAVTRSASRPSLDNPLR